MGTYIPLHSPPLLLVRSASRCVLCAMVLEAFRRQNDNSAAAMGCRLLELMNSEKSILWGRKSMGPVVSQIVAFTMNQGFNQGRIFNPNAFASSLQFLLGYGPQSAATEFEKANLEDSKNWVWGLRGVKAHSVLSTEGVIPICLDVLEHSTIDYRYGGLEFDGVRSPVLTNEETSKRFFCECFKTGGRKKRIQCH